MVTVTKILTSFPLRLRLTETFNVKSETPTKNTETKLNRNLNPRKRVHFPEPTAMASSLMRSLTCKTPAKQICSYYLTKTKRNQIVPTKIQNDEWSKTSCRKHTKELFTPSHGEGEYQVFPRFTLEARKHKGLFTLSVCFSEVVDTRL